MFNNIIKVTLITIFFFSTTSLADKIFKWVDPDGIEHYSNNPAEVPYEYFNIVSKDKIKKNKPEAVDPKESIANLPDDIDTDVKSQLELFISTEQKLQSIIVVKREEYENLKEQGNATSEELAKLENFILHAEDKLKTVKKEKDNFKKRNNLNTEN